MKKIADPTYPEMSIGKLCSGCYVAGWVLTFVAVLIFMAANVSPYLSPTADMFSGSAKVGATTAMGVTIAVVAVPVAAVAACVWPLTLLVFLVL